MSKQKEDRSDSVVSIKLMKGDCLELMKEIPDGSVDMVLTDPPYGTTACKWDSVIPFEPMWEELHRVTKDNGAIVLFGSEPFSSALRMSNIKNYKYDWIWSKSRPSGFPLAKKQPLRYFEKLSVFYSQQCVYNPQMIKGTKKRTKGANKGASIYGGDNFMKGGVTNKFYIDYYPSNIIVNANPNHNNIHPTQKPVDLLEYLIKTYTNEGETVLDFTMGSGSTGVACVNTNRNFIGIELDDGYFKIAEKRISDANL